MSLQRFKQLKEEKCLFPACILHHDIMAQVELMNQEAKTGRIFYNESGSIEFIVRLNS